MRMIDADALNDVLIQKQYSAQSMGILYTEYPNMMGIVAKQPTIEAAPVVHGRWIEDDARGRHCCSVCEFEVHDDASHVMFGDWRIAPNYCPNCGARMDGDGDA